MTNCRKITFYCPSGGPDCNYSAFTCDMSMSFTGVVTSGVTYIEEDCCAEGTIYISNGGTFTSEYCPQTFSAGTYVSYICAECIIDGNIVSSPLLDTPHPYYTNAQGDVVIQTQMITLGGPNGLNS